MIKAKSEQKAEEDSGGPEQHTPQCRHDIFDTPRGIETQCISVIRVTLRDRQPAAPALPVIRSAMPLVRPGAGTCPISRSSGARFGYSRLP